MKKCRAVIPMITRYQWQTQKQKPKNLPLLYRGKCDIAEEYQSSEKHVVWKQVRNSTSLSGGRSSSHLQNALQMLICQFAKQSLKEGLVQVCGEWEDSLDGPSAPDVPVKSAADEIRTKLYCIPGTYCSRWDNGERLSGAVKPCLPSCHQHKCPCQVLIHSGLWGYGRDRGDGSHSLTPVWKWIQIHSLECNCLFSPQTT